MNTRVLLCSLALALATCSAALADEPTSRHWIARVGVHPVNPSPNGRSEYTIENAAGLSLGATYLFTPHWGVEFFSTFPNAHELHDADFTRVGSFKMNPTSATIQYHIADSADFFRAYGAVGIAYTTFASENTKGPLATRQMNLDDSTGLTAAVGLDMNLGSKWYVNVDARWMDIDSDMTLDGAASGRLQIDPYLFGLSIGRRLR